MASSNRLLGETKQKIKDDLNAVKNFFYKLSRRPVLFVTAFIAVGVLTLLITMAYSIPTKSVQVSLTNCSAASSVRCFDGAVVSNNTIALNGSGPSTPPPPANNSASILLPNTTLGTRLNQYSNDNESVVAANLTTRGNLETTPSGTSTSVGEGQFRFNCQYSHLNYDDPIVYPGPSGHNKAHLHLFWGNTLTNAESTDSSILNTGGGSCFGYEANRSAYWMPALLDGSNKVVIPKEILMYYKTKFPSQAHPMPQGLKMIAGNASGNDLNTPKNVNGIQWQCYTGSTSYTYQGQTIPDSCLLNSTDGFPIKLNAIIYFPNCVKVNADGTPVLDSADHKSHLAYTGSGGCPSTHPYHFPQLSYHIGWPGEGNFSAWHLSSDRMNGVTLQDGQSLHADWYGGWNKTVSDHWMAGCIKPAQNCSNGVMGTGGYPLQQLKRFVDYSGPNFLTVP